jgi:hypothetical protein
MNSYEAERKTAWNENFRLVREDPVLFKKKRHWNLPANGVPAVRSARRKSYKRPDRSKRLGIR